MLVIPGETQIPQAQAARNDHLGYCFVGFFTETFKEKTKKQNYFVISFFLSHLPKGYGNRVQRGATWIYYKFFWLIPFYF